MVLVQRLQNPLVQTEENITMLMKSRAVMIEAIERAKRKPHVPQLIAAYQNGMRETVFGTALPNIGNYMADLDTLSEQDLLGYEAFWVGVAKKCPVSFVVSNGSTLLIDYEHRDLLPKGTVHAGQVYNSTISEGLAILTREANNEHRKDLAYRLQVILEWGGNPKVSLDDYTKQINDAINARA